MCAGHPAIDDCPRAHAPDAANSPRVDGGKRRRIVLVSPDTMARRPQPRQGAHHGHGGSPSKYPIKTSWVSAWAMCWRPFMPPMAWLGQHGQRRPNAQGSNRRGDLAGTGTGGVAAGRRRSAGSSGADAVLREPQHRTAGSGHYVPLSEQDTALWNMPIGREADDTLRAAGALKRPGRYPAGSGDPVSTGTIAPHRRDLRPPRGRCMGCWPGMHQQSQSCGASGRHGRVAWT